MFTHPAIHFKRLFTMLLLVLIPLTSNSALATSAQEINILDIKDPIVDFVFNNKGLMYNLTLEGSKFTEISR